jgi:hypothetical protein
LLNRDISLAELLKVLDTVIEPEDWPSYDPVTIMIELGETEPLLIEKINVLQICMYGINKVLAYPEFLLWMTSVVNNEPAEFETITIPTSLELAWTIEQAKRIATLSDQTWEPTDELKATLEYFLNEDGFSQPLAPFEFIEPKLLKPGQTEEDTKLKEIGLKAYIDHMTGLSHA